MSTEITRRLDKPFLRDCRGCNFTHSYEQTFRIAALQAGLVVDGEVAATWRGRAAKDTLTIELDEWKPIKGKTRTAVEQEAERLATHRGLTLGSIKK